VHVLLVQSIFVELLFAHAILVVLHAQNTPLHQVEEVILVFSFVSALVVLLPQVKVLVIRRNLVHHCCFFSLLVAARGVAVFTEHWREEGPTDALVVVVEAFQDHQSGDGHKNDSVTVFHLLLELLVLFYGGLDDRGEMDQLFALSGVHEVCLALLPGGLEVYKAVDEVLVVLELWVYSLDVLFVLAEKLPQSSKAFPDALSKFANGFGLLS
jgi:hypothetical protein